MLSWEADGDGESLPDFHRRRWLCHSIFPAFCQDWRRQERKFRLQAIAVRMQLYNNNASDILDTQGVDLDGSYANCDIGYAVWRR